MSTYTLKQVMYPCDQPWTEVFYDGEAKVVDNLVTVHRAEHRDTLIVKGFVEIDATETFYEDIHLDESFEVLKEETDSVEQAESEGLVKEVTAKEERVIQKDEEEIPKEALMVKPHPQPKPKPRKKAGAQA